MLIGLSASVEVRGQLPRIRLSTILPAGGQAGSDVAVTINGELAAAATELVFSHPGIEATQQIESPTEYRVARRKQRVFDVHVGEDVPNGRYEVRALGPAGLSNPRLFCVTRLQEKRFDATSNSRDKPFSLGVGEVVNGTARADKRDFYQFSAKQGQSLLIQVTAARIDSRLDASLVVHEAESGKRMGRSVQGMTRDPAMTFVAPADGHYVIEVWDRTFRGGEDYFYRLELSERAQVEAIFPPVARDGVETDFTLYGFNLPGGQPISSEPSKERLQSLTMRFKPDFTSTHPFAAGLASGVVAGATLDGASLQLPVPFSGADKVFVERTDYEVVVEQGNNETRETASAIKVPGVVAGQFFPRRDVDWYQFKAEKKETYWVELASHQLGANSDPALEVVQVKVVDGKPKYANVARADDMEGPPRSRETRRMYSGSGDCSVQLRAEAGATYLIGVRDQYNVAANDPRLVYRLRVAPRKPDFQLIAFADPERHADDRVAKPNGVSLMPGGATVIRVRLLPRHGFNEAVDVEVQGLPKGVTSSVVTLSPRLKEGFLVLTADADAEPDVRAIRIVGRSASPHVTERIARPATARHTASNLDSQLTYGRLSQDMVMAVVASDRPAARLRLTGAEVMTSVGATLNLPVQLDRKQGFTAELELVALQVPTGIKVNKAKTKDDRAELNVQLEDVNLPPGRYTFPLAAKVKEKRPKNTVAVEEADGDLKKIVALLEERVKRLADEEKKFAELGNADKQMKEELARTESLAEQPKQRLAAKLEQQRQTAAALADKLEISLKDVADAGLLSEIATLESRLETLKKDRKQLEEEWQVASRALADATKVAQTKQAEREQATRQLEALRAKKAEAETQKGAAEKRLNDVKKAELQQDAEFWVYSPAVQLNVQKSPLRLRTSKKLQVPRGAELRVPIVVERLFGFNGQVLVTPVLAGNTGVLGAPLVLGPGQTTATLSLRTSENTKLGLHEAKLEFQLQFNKTPIKDSMTCQFEVVAKK